MQRQRDRGFGGDNAGGGFRGRNVGRGFGDDNADGFGHGNEITDEKRNEWLKWLAYRSKQYSIEPAIIKVSQKDSNAKSNSGIFVYHTSYGTLEAQKQFVENYVTKPVDIILESRLKRDPLLIPGHEGTGPVMFLSTEPPFGYDLMDLMINHREDYTKFCADLYENNQDMGMDLQWTSKRMVYSNDLESNRRFISCDEATGELCLELICFQTSKTLATLKFKLFIKKSKKRKKMIDFIHRPVYDYGEPTVEDGLLKRLDESCSLFSRNFVHLQRNYFSINKIESNHDPALFFNRKLSNLVPSFMKKIQQDLIEICMFFDISFTGRKAAVAVPKRVLTEYKHQGLNYYTSQNCDLATIKCSNRNIFVNIDALKRSEYFRQGLVSKLGVLLDKI